MIRKKKYDNINKYVYKPLLKYIYILIAVRNFSVNPTEFEFSSEQRYIYNISNNKIYIRAGEKCKKHSTIMIVKKQL